jgi:AcrR family transcriptional regulator
MHVLIVHRRRDKCGEVVYNKIEQCSKHRSKKGNIMKKSDEVKEKIISITTDLIMKGEGNIDEITTRTIAEKADIGVGLINYHFQTKENLIEICIQRVIGKVISGFKPEIDKSLIGIDRLKSVVKMVADFLMNNPSVARISIIGDNRNPKLDDNTMKTVKGFSAALGECNIPDKEKVILLFALTSIIQATFLRKEMCIELLGHDFTNKGERDLFIDFIIDKLFAER